MLLRFISQALDAKRQHESVRRNLRRTLKHSRQLHRLARRDAPALVKTPQSRLAPTLARLDRREHSARAREGKDDKPRGEGVSLLQRGDEDGRGDERGEGDDRHER